MSLIITQSDSCHRLPCLGTVCVSETDILVILYRRSPDADGNDWTDGTEPSYCSPLSGSSGSLSSWCTFFCCCGFLTATCVLPAENMPASLLGSRYRFCCHPAHLHAPAPVLAHLYLGVMWTEQIPRSHSVQGESFFALIILVDDSFEYPLSHFVFCFF